MSDQELSTSEQHDPKDSGLTADELGALPTYDPEAPVDRADVISEAGKWIAAWAGRFLLVVAALVVIGIGLRYVSGAIMPTLLALLVASVLWPLTALGRRLGLPNALSALLSLLLGLGIIGGLFALIAPAVASQWDQLRTQSIDGIRRIQAWVSGPPLNINDEELNRYISQGLAWLQDRSGDILASVLNIGGSVGSGLVTLLTTVIITFFMLKDGHSFVAWMRGVVGRRAGFHVSELLTRMWNTLSGYIRTQAVVSFVDGAFIGLGVFLLGVPLAFPIAVLTFMAGFIPIVGAVTAGSIAVLVALVSNGFTTALLVLAVVLGVQQLEGNILQPLLQSRVMKLHPVIVLLAVLLGGTWAGIIGAFLAVPVAATMAVLLRYLGDLTDLRTGDRTAADIEWVTDEGQTVGSESERAAASFKALVRGRKSSPDHDRVRIEDGPWDWRRLFSRMGVGQAPQPEQNDEKSREERDD